MNPAGVLLLHPVLLKPIERRGVRLTSAVTIFVALLLVALGLG